MAGLFISALLAYLLTKVNKQLGAWVTVLAPIAALAVLVRLGSAAQPAERLLFLQFHMTEYGWFFAVIMLTVFACVSFFNVYWMKKIAHPAAYNLLYLLALTGTLGAFFAVDFITLFIFWEMIVWTSMFIIPMGKSRSASVVYYAFSALGSVSMLFGLLFLHSHTGTFIITDALNAAANDPTLAWVTFFTIGVAGLVKLGVFPFHVWLPKAHGSAPDTFSPVLSGGLVKVGGFAVFLLVAALSSSKALEPNFLLLGRPLSMPLPNEILALLGAVSIVIGTLMAIRQDDFKKLIAYSSVANGGYILIGLAMGNALSVGGALMHILAHAFASAAAFLAAAAVVHRTGTTKMSELGGLIHRMPLTYLVYLIAIISMAGIPPMAGFISKWMIFQSMIKNGMIFVAAAAFFGSIGSFLYVFRPLSAVFLGQLSTKHENVKEAPALMQIPMIALSLITLFFGVVPNFALRVISRVQTSVGLPGLTLEGTKIMGSNGVLDPTLITIVFGVGFVVALILFLLHPKSRKVGLMDTYTASEFIWTPELLHYAHDFYAPFERLYNKAPRTESFYSAVVKKVDELGRLASYAFFSYKPGTVVLWIVVVTVSLLWGGSLWM
jgi:NADH-quinone oxidoreductase subunit M